MLEPLVHGGGAGQGRAGEAARRVIVSAGRDRTETGVAEDRSEWSWSGKKGEAP